MQYRHPPTQEHLVYSHTICMYMYNHVHICNIFQRVYVCIMPFSNVTILFNQHFIIVGNIVGKSPTGILTLFIWSWNPWNPKILEAFSTVPCLLCIWYCKFAAYACKFQTNRSMNNKQYHNMQKKCNIVIRRSKNTSFTHIYYVCTYTYMQYIQRIYIYRNINIYIYISVCV